MQTTGALLRSGEAYARVAVTLGSIDRTGEYRRGQDSDLRTQRHPQLKPLSRLKTGSQETKVQQRTFNSSNIKTLFCTPDLFRLGRVGTVTLIIWFKFWVSKCETKG